MTELLVPIDFSDATAAVLTTAAQLAKSLDARISLLHVLDGHRQHAPAAENLQAVNVEVERPAALQDQGHALGQSLRMVHLSADDNATALQRQSQFQCQVDALRAQGLRVDPILVSGRPIEKILLEADRLRPAFIVLGSHGHGALHHLLLGGVSEGVLRKAGCPVVIVPCHRG